MNFRAGPVLGGAASLDARVFFDCHERRERFLPRQFWFQPLQQNRAPLLHRRVRRSVLAEQLIRAERARSVAEFGDQLGDELGLPQCSPTGGDRLGRLFCQQVEVDLKSLMSQHTEQLTRSFESELQDERSGIGIVALDQSVQHVLRRITEQRLGKCRFEQPETRVESRLDRLRPKQTRAERMDRADSRRIEAAHQREPVIDLISRALLQPLLTGRANAIAHLARGFVGERDRDQRVEFGGIVSRFEALQKSLRQHERLAATGSRREGNGDSARLDGCRLLLGESGAEGVTGHL